MLFLRFLLGRVGTNGDFLAYFYLMQKFVAHPYVLLHSTFLHNLSKVASFMVSRAGLKKLSLLRQARAVVFVYATAKMQKRGMHTKKIALCIYKASCGIVNNKLS